jgi:hypothetical protein
VAGGALARPSKKAVAEGDTVVWGDESGFSLLPHAVRTWAPKGETPVLRVKLTHDQLSAISGITLDGRLFMQTREDAFDSEGAVGFLRVLLRKIRGQVLVISRRLAHPQGAADQRLFGARSRQTAAPGAVAGVRAGPESGRGDLELSEAGGAQEPRCADVAERAYTSAGPRSVCAVRVNAVSTGQH